MYRWRAVLKRFFAIRHNGQWIVIDLDQRGGILGDVARIGDDDGDGFAHMNHFAISQSRSVEILPVGRAGQPHHEPLFYKIRSEIRECENGMDTGQGTRGLAVDIPDRCVCVRAAQKGRMLQTTIGDVIDKAAIAGEESRVFEAFRAAAKNFRAAHLLMHPFRP